ncbi:hypothetical protein PLICRDRAFT_616982 [Plicaturopsis crispa FD-325 SS-3]|nr:hypothetical protein PLICRDRAFT_616982 [Plicaturopsis crispa FD-325 SS-3]
MSRSQAVARPTRTAPPRTCRVTKVAPSSSATVTPPTTTTPKPQVTTTATTTTPTSQEPATRVDDVDHPKRPLNAYFLYLQKMRPLYTGKQGEITRAIGKSWHALSAEEKQLYKDDAACVSKEHTKEHPGYVYKPRRPEEIAREKREKELARRAKREGKASGATQSMAKSKRGKGKSSGRKVKSKRATSSPLGDFSGPVESRPTSSTPAPAEAAPPTGASFGAQLDPDGCAPHASMPYNPAHYYQPPPMMPMHHYPTMAPLLDVPSPGPYVMRQHSAPYGYYPQSQPSQNEYENHAYAAAPAPPSSVFGGGPCDAIGRRSRTEEKGPSATLAPYERRLQELNGFPLDPALVMEGYPSTSL